MKKFLLTIFFIFFWCNISFSNILIKDCKTIYPAGHFESNPDKEVVSKINGKKEYYISYEDGKIYHTSVSSNSTLKSLEIAEEEGLPTPTASKVNNYNYEIQFIDENEVIGIRIQEYDQPKFNHYEEITIDLKSFRILKRVFADTSGGKEMINLMKSAVKNYPLNQICEKDESFKKNQVSSGTAFNLEQKNYNCLEKDSSLKNEIKIIKKYNSEYLLASENSGYGEVLSFMKISKESLTSYTMELKWDVVHVSTLKSLKGSTEFIVYTYRLSKDQLNQIKPLKSKFLDTSNITTFELTEKELKNEVSIYNKITEILSLSKKEVVGDPLIYICNNGNEKTSKSNNSKPPIELINAMKQGCMGDNPYEKRKNFCICYGDWFYDNLNNDEFDKFIYSSKEDKIKFLERNNIVKTCEAVSIFDLEKLKGGIIKKP